ncbi:MAG: LysE/ArgO family amino acid transporter [Leptothrix sp. (in: b-proteobacteria)]
MPAAVALFLQSMLIGLSIAAPVGPIGLLTIQRSLQRGARAGLATGLGAAVADGLYGAVGAFGVTGLIAWLSAARPWLVWGGGACLLWMAWGIWRAPVATQAAQLTPEAGEGDDPASLWRCFASTLLLTLANPATILSFVAVFGALAGRFTLAQPKVMIAGVFIGSALWWWLLSSVVGRLRERFDAVWRRRVHRASALLLAALALWQLPGGWA